MRVAVADACCYTDKQTVWKPTATVANLGTNDQDPVSRPFAAIQNNMLTFFLTEIDRKRFPLHFYSIRSLFCL